MWFWNNQSDDTKPILGQWLGLSHRLGSALCYWILSEKGKVLSQNKVQHLTAEEPRYPDLQERICDYHGSLEDTLGSEEFGTSLDGYDSFIMMMKRLLLRSTPTRRGIKDLHITLR